MAALRIKFQLPMTASKLLPALAPARSFLSDLFPSLSVFVSISEESFWWERVSSCPVLFCDLSI